MVSQFAVETDYDYTVTQHILINSIKYILVQFVHEMKW